MSAPIAHGPARARRWVRAPARAVTLLALAAASASTRSAVASVERDAPDTALVAAMRGRSPLAADLLEQGERLAMAGSLEEALRSFRTGRTEFPVDAGLFGRRECQILTSLGRRDEAVYACWHAMQDLRSPAVIAATVRALVSGPAAPTFDDVHQALTLLLVEKTNSPTVQPRLAAAMCDIAESIGDATMLQHCTEELECAAPEYPPTLRARKALDAQCPPARFWIGWLAIAGALVVTVLDWARHRLGRSGRTAAVTAGGLAVLLSFQATARADLPPAPPEALLSEWAVDDKDPEAHVPSLEQFKSDPLQGGYWLQDAIMKAELASKHGDHKAAIKYYRALYKAVPDKAISLTRLCTEYETVGDLNAAINACAGALMLDGLTINDYAHYVRLVLSKPGPLNPKEVESLSNVIAHIRESTPDTGAADELECELGVRTSDVAKLRECTAGLAATAPSDPKTISYEWALAMREGKFDRARDLLTQAKAAGAKDDSLRGMEQAVEAGSKRQVRWFAVGACGAVLIALALAYGFVAAARRRSVTVHA